MSHYRDLPKNHATYLLSLRSRHNILFHNINSHQNLKATSASTQMLTSFIVLLPYNATIGYEIYDIIFPLTFTREDIIHLSTLTNSPPQSEGSFIKDIPNLKSYIEQTTSVTDINYVETV